MKFINIYKIVSVLLLAAIMLSTGYYLFLWNGFEVPVLARPLRFSQATVVIDAGHGGEDGGAVSPAGNIESFVNLAIAKRLDAVLGLYGVDVVMLRTEDVSLHDPESSTIRQKKVSDLHNRVKRIESISNATVISIHQNTYEGSSRYHGAQVFYTNNGLTLSFAQFTQEILRLVLDPENNRQATEIPDTVYLMNHITCPAILVECGFLSNPSEDALLQTGSYQTKIAIALAGAYLGYEDVKMEGESPK